jgi:hypothetical protein
LRYFRSPAIFEFFNTIPLEADIVRAGRHVSKVPGTDIGDAFETTRQALEFRVDEREKC